MDETDHEVSRYEIMEVATKDLTGIYAICTAEAITWLWNWKSAEDLQEAKAAIEYMLQRMETKNGKV